MCAFGEYCKRSQYKFPSFGWKGDAELPISYRVWVGRLGYRKHLRLSKKQRYFFETILGILLSLYNLSKLNQWGFMSPCPIYEQRCPLTQQRSFCWADDEAICRFNDNNYCIFVATSDEVDALFLDPTHSSNSIQSLLCTHFCGIFSSGFLSAYNPSGHCSKLLLNRSRAHIERG